MTTSTPEIATFPTYPFRMSSANGFPDQDTVNAKLSALPRTASSSASRRPLRMRMACTNCHSAKVKCSGERSGCTRCRDNGLTCDYEISMVGRMSIKRGKRKRHEKPAEKAQQQQQEKTQHQQQQHDQRSKRASTHSSSTTNEPSPQRELPPYEHRQSRLGVEHVTPQDLPPHGSAEMVDLNGPSLGHDEHSSHDLLPDSIISAIDQGNFDEFPMFNHPGLDSNMVTMRESPPLAGPPATVTLPQTSITCDDSFSYDHDTMLDLGETLPHAFPTPPDLLQQGFDTGLQTPSSVVPCNYSDLGAPTRASVSGSLSYGESTDVGVEQPPQTPLSSLMKIIHDLELGVRSTGPVRIDSRLIMNRKAMAGLRVAIGKESFRTCNSCIVLVASALDLILENYGYIIDAINSEEGPNVNAAVDGEWEFTNLITLPTANTMIDDLPSHEKSQCPRKTGSGACSYASTMQLRIGCYELSGEDQITLRNHIIGKELRRCIEIARICVTFSQSNSGRGFANNNRVRASLQADTEASAYRLIASLESRGEEYMFIKP